MENNIQTTTQSADETSQLDKPITVKLLLSYALPMIFAQVIMQTLSIVDGIFAMRGLGEMPMAAITVVNPLVMLMMAVGVLFSAGGSALVVKKVGMGISILGSVVGITLNGIFIFVFGWGIASLAWATIISASLPVIIAVCFFARNRKGNIYFARPKFDIKALGVSMLNGAGTAITALSMAAVLIALPQGFGLTGVWLAWPLTEALAIFASAFFLLKMGKRYHYIGGAKQLTAFG